MAEQNDGLDRVVQVWDLASGKERWTTKAAAKPFAQVGNALVAQSEDGKLRALDAKTGKLGTCSLAVQLQFADGLGTNHSAIGTADAKHAWIAEAGDYTISAGDSSHNLPLKATFHLAETITIKEGS